MGWPNETKGSHSGQAPEATVWTKTSTCAYQTECTSRSNSTRPWKTASRSIHTAIAARTRRATRFAAREPPARERRVVAEGCIVGAEASAWWRAGQGRRHRLG